MEESEGFGRNPKLRKATVACEDSVQSKKKNGSFKQVLQEIVCPLLVFKRYI